LRRQVCQAGANGGSAGINSISWDGTNNFGEILESGAYLLRVAQGDKIIYNGKIIILKD
jgi:flagellar hook assembly protein FlgD